MRIELAYRSNTIRIDSQVTARPFAVEDLRTLYAIEEACFEPPVRFSRALIRSLVHHPECRTWVGLANDLVVGFAILALHSEEDPSAAYIWTIEVLPSVRRKGVARQLLARLEESTLNAGRAAIELHVSERNAGASALYTAAGYRKIGVEPAYYGRREDALRYRKAISAMV